MKWIVFLILAWLLTQCTPPSDASSQTHLFASESLTPNLQKIEPPAEPVAKIPVPKPGQTLGIAYAMQEDWKSAIPCLEKEAERSDLVSLRPELLYQLGRAYFSTDQLAFAKKCFGDLLRESSTFPKIDMACYSLYAIANREGSPVDATSWLTKIQQDFPTSSAIRWTHLDLGLQEIQKQNYGEAWSLLSKAIFKTTDSDLYKNALPALRELSEKLFFSSKRISGLDYYEVQSGDNLSKIAKKYQLTPGFLLYLNHLSSTTIRAGQFLKVFQGGAVSVQVNKANYSLVIFCGDHYIRDYRIGLGKEDKTPEGEFEIDSKVENPKWYNEGKVYEFGDPQNVLGTRWLGFKDQPGVTGFGIHGTLAPTSIGKNESNGCVRMKNEEIEELFPMIPVGCKVQIGS